MTPQMFWTIVVLSSSISAAITLIAFTIRWRLEFNEWFWKEWF